MTTTLPKNLGLRAQILLGLGLVTLFAVLSTGYLALWVSGGALRAQREFCSLSVAAATAAAVSAVVDGHEPLASPTNRAPLDALLRSLDGKGDLVQISILAPGGRPVMDRPPRGPDDVDPSVAAAVLSGTAPLLNYRFGPLGEVQLLAYAGISVAGHVLGAVRITFPAPPPVAAVIGQSGWWLPALAVADAALVLSLVFLVVTQLVVRPLRDMQKATTRVTAGDWDQQIAAQGPREIAALASAFNQMTTSLARQREQLIRSEKLASVGQLAAGVAHEIGNPLAAILGYVDILRADVGTGGPGALSPGDRHDALRRVKAETQRIHRIIQDLLAYSRPSREEAVATDPLKVVEAARSLLAPQARFRDVIVVVEPQGPSETVLVSPERLTQVFVNLLLNAADAMGGRGRIHIKATTEPAQIKIRIADDGPGIPAETRRKVFDPFFTTKDPGQGTGLGLPISRSIVESYGGTLELDHADGTVGTGAVFVLTLPCPANRPYIPARGP